MSKQNTNDEKILQLKVQIKEKKSKLKGKKRFIPVTNCSLELRGIRYNLNVSNKEQLITLLLELNLFKMSAIDLDLEDDYIISGFSVDEWIKDIKAKLEIIVMMDEERKLQVLEGKLEYMLSNEKRIELEINEIESLIK